MPNTLKKQSFAKASRSRSRAKKHFAVLVQMSDEDLMSQFQAGTV